MRGIIGRRWRGLTRVFLLTSAIGVLAGCSATTGEAERLTAVSSVDEPATAVPVPTVLAPTTSPPAAPTAVPTSAPAPTPTAVLPTFANPPSPEKAKTAAEFGVDLIRFEPGNTGLWQYEANNFLHPIALAVWQETAFLLDGGRVLAINLASPEPPRRLLAPGMDIDGVRVLEPLDLAVAGDTLLALDRSGDVYAYDLLNDAWQLERYDRPVDDTSGHYFVAISGEEAGNGRYLLETNYKYVLRYADGERDQLWNLPETRAVDISAFGGDVYALLRDMTATTGRLMRYQDTRLLDSFAPSVPLDRPRQVAASATAVYVLDQAGLRLLAFDRENGRLQTVYQTPQDNPISVMTLDPSGRLLLAGRDRLYFFNQPDKLATISGGDILLGAQPHDTAVLAQITGLAMPIGGSGIAQRDLQMPGAPRHYRLGIHEGADFYWQPGTPALAAADGVVVRALVDYAQPTAVQFAAWRAETQEAGYTTPTAFDAYRGRQVWIRHENGLVTRYVHLSAIASGIVEGAAVKQGQVIGAVGNSGSPLSLESETADAHLHFEIRLGDYYVGQFVRPIEAREWIAMALKNDE